MRFFRRVYLSYIRLSSRKRAVTYCTKVRIKQEAQLLQKGRAILRVVKNVAKSLKIVQGHSKLHR